jgi:uncharacterized protein (TIGR04141 family)
MPTGMPKINTFSLYLAKPEVVEFDDLLSDVGRSLVQQGRAFKLEAPAFANGAALFTFPGHRHEPKWVEQLRPFFAIPQELGAQSPCAVVVFKTDGRLFALTFAFGHVYLDDARLEVDFGLRVAVNGVSDEKLRSIERSNIGAAIRDYAQAARQRDLRSFGFDDALDLIRKVSGNTEDETFAHRLTGSRALRFSKKIELDDVPAFAIEAVKLFRSDAYKNTAFGVIDFLAPVSDSTVLLALDDALVHGIRVGTDEFEVAIPDILPEAIGSFRFENARLSGFHPDLSLELYRTGLGDRLSKLSLDDLKRHKVAAYGGDDDQLIDQWSLHRSLVGSLVLAGERHALNEGSWYRVDQKFKDAADAEFVRLSVPPDPNFRPLKKVYQGTGKRDQRPVYQSEKSYNEEIAQEAGYLLMDTKLITIDGVPGPGLEACDLLDVAGRRFIHVKKSSRQSSVLSHFFKQGSNAAQMVKRYEAFKRGIIETIRAGYGDHGANELEKALDDRWTVEFRIADFPREDGSHNIPFFSKLTLRDEARQIAAMGFDVRVGFITLTRT